MFRFSPREDHLLGRSQRPSLRRLLLLKYLVPVEAVGQEPHLLLLSSPREAVVAVVEHEYVVSLLRPTCLLL